MVMMREQFVYVWNSIGIWLNGCFVWVKLNAWLSLKEVSELAGTIVPILALIWWCIKICQTLKKKRDEKD